jgi:nucleoside-diphosphate-sugar epimerase
MYSSTNDVRTIWITGGAGFLGRRLTRELSGKGCKVVSLSRRTSPDADESIAIDLVSSAHKLRQLLDAEGPPDVVVHAASRQPGRFSFKEFVAGNVITTQNLLDALRTTPPRQIIYTSTLSVYSRSSDLPLTEKHPASHAEPYGATKRWAEQLMESFKESQISILRLPSLYGRGQADSFIDGLATLALKNETIDLFSRGRTIRDALHVSDVVTAIGNCIQHTAEKQCVLMNLGCGRPIPTIEYARALVEAFESRSTITESDRESSHFDAYASISLANQLIGFEPTELKESLRIYANELRS